MTITFAYEPNTELRRVVALDGDQRIGELAWLATGGAVIQAGVVPAYRGQMIAVAMWEYANSAAVPEAERPRRPQPGEVRTPVAEAAYLKGRSRREAREAGEIVEPLHPSVRPE